MTYLLALSSFLSRALGIIRHNRFAAVFGASDISDAYFAAFQIPDLIYSIIIYGALSAAFVPLFVTYMKKGADSERARMWEFTNAVMTLLMTIIFILIVILFLLAPYIVTLLYPGFAADTQATTISLMRIMLLSPLFFGFSAVFSGIQTAYRHFIFYAIAPILYNLSIIFGIVYLSPQYGIFGVAYGVAFGALLHALIQLPIVIRFGFRFHPVFAWFRDDLRKLICLAIPRVLGIGLLQINLLVEGLIASLGMVGGLSVLRYAQDIQSFPVGIVGLSVAISSFSTLSALALIDDGKKSFIGHVSKKISSILFLIVPSAVGLFFLRDPIIKIILQSGVFTAEDALLTSGTLGILCIGLFGASLTPLLSRAFYALQNTKTPFFLGLFTVVLNTTLSLILAPRYGIHGLATASVIAVTAQLILLSFFLKRSFKEKICLFPLKQVVRILTPSFVMAMILNGFLYLFTLPESSFWLFLYLFAVIFVCCLSYFFVAILIKAPEITDNVFVKKLLHRTKTG